MYPLTIRQAMIFMKARLLNPGAPTEGLMPSVSIDSRSINEGQAFFAIVGEHMDGHNYLGEVMGKRPGTLVISDSSNLYPGDTTLLDTDRTWGKNLFDGNLSIPFLQVEDTTRALQDLAGGIRSLWGGHLVGITGSMGKTTTRHYAACLLEDVYPVHCTKGNLNNHIGLPLTLLDLEKRHKLSILEMGMNHAGEISRLSGICRPDTAVITNIAPVHLEFFNSLEDIASAKAEILEHLAPGGTFVYNLDDRLLCALAEDFHGPKVSFGFSAGADVRISDLVITDIESSSFTLTVKSWPEPVKLELNAAGKPAALNLAAAVASVIQHGLTPDILASAVPRLSSPEKRGRVSETRGITVWDDSYNSNPAALGTLLESLKDLQGFKRIILVLGDMLELGVKSPELHEECGRKAAESGARVLFTVGNEARLIGKGAFKSGLSAENIFSFSNSSEAAEPLKKFAAAGDLVVVKGSRGMKMEHIINRLREEE